MVKKPSYEELEQRIKELERAESGRKWAEKALRESEGKYHAYLEHANDGISVVHKGKLTFVNSRLAEIMGFKVDELEGKDFLQFVPKGELNQITDNLKRRLVGEEVPQVYESRILHKDNSEIDVEFNISTLESNDEPATLTIIRDITERKQAEEMLRKKQVIIESNIKYLENMNNISESVSQSTEVDEMIKRVIEDVFNIFKVDRAWLLYPCDPDSSTFQVPYEHSKPEYPGALKSGVDSPVDEGIKQIFDDLLSTDRAVTYDLSNESFRNSEPVKKFYMQSQMVIAIHPRTGSPWVLGLHQCSHERIWTSEEQILFKDISLRVKDALSHLLLLKELFDREQFLSRIIDQSPFATWISDSEGTLQRVNPALKRFLNLTDEQLVGKYNVLNDTIAERQGLQPLFRTVFEDGKTITFSLEWDGNDMPSMDLKGSKSVSIEATMFPVHNPEGKLTNVVVNWIDITERKQTEEALRKSEERLRIQNQIANIFLTKSDEDMYGEILSVVLGIMESKFGIFGYIDEQGDLVCPSMTKDIWDQCKLSDKTIVFPEDTWGKSIWGNGLRTGLSAYSNKPFKVPEGHIPVNKCLIVPIVYQQNSIGLFTVANKSTDYTESDKQFLEEMAEHVAPVLNARIEKERSNKALRESEEKLARSKKMEAMGLMAGGVAHDLNNILSGIVSYPELLLLDLPEDSPLRRPIKTIQESGMRAADVVEDLLTVARGVAGGKEVLNLNTLITEYLGSAEHRKLERIHTLSTFEIDLDSELLNITGSASHIKKILMNLIINASEAIEGKGTVTVSTVSRYLDEPLKGYEDVRAGEYVLLRVSDDGSGISPQDLDRIFEPFYTKKVMGRSGTGLGLAVVWNSMQDHGGYINVNTSEKGTAFDLYFPVTREEAAAEGEEASLEDCLGHGEKVLVVDDEVRQREIASGILTRLGYTAETVSSGEEAIQYVKTNPVDLISS